MKNIFSTSVFVLIVCLAATMNMTAQTPLKDETRFPWGTATGAFIQDWLLRRIPNQDEKGYNTDFLQDHGGEWELSPSPE